MTFISNFFVSLQRQSYTFAQKVRIFHEVGPYALAVWLMRIKRVYMIGVNTKTWPGHFRCKGNKKS